jgi:exodeoxyribonuclease X
MIRAVDVETLGLEPDSGICEIGWCDLVELDGKWTFGMPMSTLVNPGKPIPPAASAIHHIVDADVMGAPTLEQALPLLEFDSGHYYAAHFASFEASFLPDLKPLICTWKVGVTLAPNAPGHKLQELRYWLRLDVDRALADQAHRAGPDAYVCAAFLARMLNSGKMGFRDMATLSGGPVVLPYLTFGMHAMKPVHGWTGDPEGSWSYDVPSDYFEWMLKQKDMDPNALHTAREVLRIRSAA